jgi:nitrous oxidase accessory protein NosD
VGWINFTLGLGYNFPAKARASLGEPGGNLIYHNNFINNTYFPVSSNSQNSWDVGYPRGGNYFSDYKGSDNCSGPYQNETGSDGLGDTPYPLARARRSLLTLGAF